MRICATKTSNQTFYFREAGTNSNVSLIGIRTSTITIYRQFDDGTADSAIYSSTHNSTLGDWKHIAIVHPSQSSEPPKLYLNSVELSSTGYSVASGLPNREIGNFLVHPDQADLHLQDLVIWNKELTEPDIDNIYAQLNEIGNDDTIITVAQIKERLRALARS